MENTLLVRARFHALAYRSLTLARLVRLDSRSECARVGAPHKACFGGGRPGPRARTRQEGGRCARNRPHRDRQEPVSSHYKNPPIQLLYCGAGHGWWRLNPSYMVGRVVNGGQGAPKACPTHSYQLRAQSLSEAMRRSHLRREAEMAGTLPDFKRCARCGKVKPRDDFGVRYNKTKTLGERVYLRPRCLACETATTGERVARAKAEDPEGYREMRRRVSTRNNLKRRHPKRALVEVAPFVEFWNSLNGQRPVLDDILSRALLRILSGEQEQAEINTIDQLLVAAGRQDMVNTLYGRF